MVRLFLEHGAEVGAVIATSDWTLLMKAAWLGHEEVVELLLEHGAVATARNKARALQAEEIQFSNWLEMLEVFHPGLILSSKSPANAQHPSPCRLA